MNKSLSYVDSVNVDSENVHSESVDSENVDSGKNESRRDFFMRIGRLTVLGAVSVSATQFFIRSLDCEGHSVCDACLVVKECDLPLGKNFKDEGGSANPVENNPVRPIDLSTLKEINYGT